MQRTLLAGALTLALLLVPFGASATDVVKEPEEEGPVAFATQPSGTADDTYVINYEPNSFEGRTSGVTKVVGCSYDCAGWVNFPRGFDFYGTTYNGAYFSSNGLVNFESYDSSYYNSISGLSGKKALAPFWEDMRFDGCSNSGWFFQDGGDHMYFRYSGRPWSSYYGGCGSVNFEVLLHDSGVIEFRYGANNEAWGLRPTTGISAKTYSTATTLWATDGEYRNWALNTVFGGMECVDVPTTTHSVSGTLGDAGWYRSTPSIGLSADCDVDATHYRVNGGAFQTYAGAFTLGDGVNVVEYYSTAAAGTENVKSTTVKVDTAPPVVSMSREDGLLGEDGWMRTAPTYTLSATDATSGVDELRWAVDGTPSNVYGGAFQMDVEGVHTVYWNGRDVAGNFAPTGADQVKLDTIAPVSTHAIGEPATVMDDGVHLTSATTIALSATDAAPWDTSGVDRIEYWIDGGDYTGAVQTYEDAITLAGADGAYTVSYRALDRAGNVEETATIEVVLDNSGPLVDILTPYDNSLTSGPLTLDADTGANAIGWRYVDVTAAIEDATTISHTEFLVDGEVLHVAEEGAWAWTWDARGYEPGEHVITVRSTDTLGNVGEDAVTVFLLPGQTTEQVLESIWG